MTLDERCLINKRPCKETFRAANGKIERATCIGDMPVLVTTVDGKRVQLAFTNVRCVPNSTTHSSP